METGYKVAYCPTKQLRYMQIYLISNQTFLIGTYIQLATFNLYPGSTVLASFNLSGNNILLYLQGDLGGDGVRQQPGVEQQQPPGRRRNVPERPPHADSVRSHRCPGAEARHGRDHGPRSGNSRYEGCSVETAQGESGGRGLRVGLNLIFMSGARGATADQWMTKSQSEEEE